MPQVYQDTISFWIPVLACSQSRDIPSDDYSRVVADLALPILNRLHGWNPQEDINSGENCWEDGKYNPEKDYWKDLKEATHRLMSSNMMYLTVRVNKDGSLTPIKIQSREEIFGLNECFR